MLKKITILLSIALLTLNCNTIPEVPEEQVPVINQDKKESENSTKLSDEVKQEDETDKTDVVENSKSVNEDKSEPLIKKENNTFIKVNIPDNLDSTINSATKIELRVSGDGIVGVDSFTLDKSNLILNTHLELGEKNIEFVALDSSNNRLLESKIEANVLDNNSNEFSIDINQIVYYKSSSDTDTSNNSSKSNSPIIKGPDVVVKVNLKPDNTEVSSED